MNVVVKGDTIGPLKLIEMKRVKDSKVTIWAPTGDPKVDVRFEEPLVCVYDEEKEILRCGNK